MARVIAPNKEYAGVSAGVPFYGGEAHTDDPYILGWFRTHGYEVEEEGCGGPDEPEAGQMPDLLAPEPEEEAEKPVAPAQKKGRKKEA